MGNFLLGFKALFRIWDDQFFADRVQKLIETPELEAIQKSEATTTTSSTIGAESKKGSEVSAAASVQQRSEALTLLSVLQREGRFLDFLLEPMDAYSDAEIGAAVRPLHKDCRQVITRIFAIEPLLKGLPEENAKTKVPVGYDPAQYKLTGKSTATLPAEGDVIHPGWQATQCQLPTWTGRKESEMIISPSEIELK